MGRVLGWDIGGTKCAIVLGSTGEDGLTITDRRSYPTRPVGPEPMLDDLIRATRDMLADHGIRSQALTGIGVACGGPLDSVGGRILEPPNLPGWVDVPIVRRLQEAFGVTAVLENDADACALAEWRFGAGRGVQDMIFLTCGTGMGAGLILGGRLHRGSHGLAGEVGHVRLSPEGPEGHGKCGSFEGFVSGGGIQRQLRSGLAQGADDEVDSGRSRPGEDGGAVAAMFAAARRGEAAALSLVERIAEHLGQGISMLIDIIDPALVVLGSIFVRQEDLLRPGMERVIRREVLMPDARRCPIVPAGLGESVADHACLAIIDGDRT